MHNKPPAIEKSIYWLPHGGLVDYNEAFRRQSIQQAFFKSRKPPNCNKAQKQEFSIPSSGQQEFSILCCSLLDCAAEFFGFPGANKHSFSRDKFQDYNRVNFFGRL